MKRVKQTAETPAAEPPSKKMKLNPFDWFLHSAGSQSCCTTVRGSNVDVPLTERLLHEIRAHEQIPMPNVASFEPLKWWGEQHVQYSLLSDIAHRLLVIPTSSSGCERHFSAFNARDIVTGQLEMWAIAQRDGRPA